MKMDETKQMNELQHRSYLTEFSPSQDEQKIVGYAAIFNVLSSDLGGFKERIVTGAFAKSLREEDVRAFWNHDPNFPLARTKNGSLQLEEDITGLRYSITPPDTSYARDLKENIRSGIVNQSSFAFQILKRSMESEAGMPVQVLHEVRLVDVSPVSIPAYSQTYAALRSMAIELTSGIRLEDALGDDPEFARRCLEGLALYARAGRVLSAKTENRLREAIAMLDEVLSQLESAPMEASAAPRMDLRKRKLGLITNT
jgi:HK97 family phage prohead protease